MNRWWLVPYYRRVPRVLPSGEITNDGTGPITQGRPIARLIQWLGIAVRIHEILRSDSGRNPHNHPWPYVTIVLRGGYWETRYTEFGVWRDVRWHGPGSVLFRRPNSFHLLSLPPGKSTTTLFITGAKSQSWGFAKDGEVINWKNYKEPQ